MRTPSPHDIVDAVLWIKFNFVIISGILILEIIQNYYLVDVDSAPVCGSPVMDPVKHFQVLAQIESLLLECFNH